jgi:hypothetical protein
LAFFEFLRRNDANCFFVRSETRCAEPGRGSRLSLEHYTPTPDVKAGDSKQSRFFIGGVDPLAKRMCRIAA